LEGGIGYFDRMEVDIATNTWLPEYSADFDLVEVWNGFDLARPAKTEANFQEWLAMLARGHAHVATGNSDSHTVRTQWSGYQRNYVYVAPERDDVDRYLPTDQDAAIDRDAATDQDAEVDSATWAPSSFS